MSSESPVPPRAAKNSGCLAALVFAGGFLCGIGASAAVVIAVTSQSHAKWIGPVAFLGLTAGTVSTLVGMWRRPGSLWKFFFLGFLVALLLAGTCFSAILMG